MAEKPILFSGGMVRAILEGRKTQTRRVITVPWHNGRRCQPYGPYWNIENGKLYGADEYGDFHEQASPYGGLGDRLWVRETFVIENPAHYGYDYTLPTDRPVAYHDAEQTEPLIPHYRATEPEPHIVPEGLDSWDDRTRWTPSIFMPKWAARIWLEITGVRVERLQNITHCDIFREGIDTEPNPKKQYPENLKAAFINVWDSLNAKRGYGWDKNPWVWVIEFSKANGKLAAATHCESQRPKPQKGMSKHGNQN